VGLVRLFLALVVVFDHARASCLRPLKLDVNVLYALGLNAGYAVMYFYIISGFLVGYALRNKYPASAEGSITFYKNRFIRIFSLYWPTAFLVLAFIPESREIFLRNTLIDKFTNIFLLGADWNVGFSHYPERNDAAVILQLYQSWTLGAELTFYMLAPWILRSHRLSIGFFVLSAVIRAAIVYKLGFSEAWTYRFFPATFLFFLLGHLAGVFAEYFAQFKKPSTGIVLITLAVFFLVFPSYTDWDAPRFWLSIFTFAFTLPSLFAWTKDNKMLNFLGDLSFPVYLLHLVIIYMLDKTGYINFVFIRFGVSEITAYLIVGSALTLSIAAAIVVHRHIERPVAFWMHRIFEKPIKTHVTQEM
jgi:peptidoglycan/LPS O-acetylase OafA/YrhL